MSTAIILCDDAVRGHGQLEQHSRCGNLQVETNLERCVLARIELDPCYRDREFAVGGDVGDEASTSFETGTDIIDNDFHRYVVSGVHAAREAVQRHNRQQTAPWNRVTVTSR